MLQNSPNNQKEPTEKQEKALITPYVTIDQERSSYPTSGGATIVNLSSLTIVELLFSPTILSDDSENIFHGKFAGVQHFTAVILQVKLLRSC